MQTPNTASPWNAGWWRLVAVVACLAAGGGGKAQVPNDDCDHALTLFPQFATAQCSVPGQAGFTPSLIDSTDLAVVNVPYPVPPPTCTGIGYPGYVLGPAKDLWYKAYGQWGYGWSIESPDTCHLTVWIGGGCANMIPLFCYASPGGSIDQPYNYHCSWHPADTIYLQISNKSAFAPDARFQLCFTSSCPAEAGAPYVFSEPTPVQCAVDEVVTVPCSGPQEADGEIHLSVLLGTPPFNVTWNDGADSFDRVGLAAGAYGYTLHDGTGCAQDGTAVVQSQVATGVGSLSIGGLHWGFDVDRSISAGPFKIPYSVAYAEMLLVDMQGRIVGHGVVRHSELTFSTIPNSAGLYSILCQNAVLPRWLGNLSIH